MSTRNRRQRQAAVPTKEVDAPPRRENEFERSVDEDSKSKRPAILRPSKYEYDPDKEFEGLENPKYQPFDMSFQKDPWGNEISEVRATLYETDGAGHYRLQSYDKPGLLEAIGKAQKFWTAKNSTLKELVEADGKDLLIERASDKASAMMTKLLSEGRSVEQAIQALRESWDEGDMSDGGESRGGSIAQGWTNNRYGSGRDSYAEYMPLLGGPWSKQLYLYYYLDMHRKAFENFHHHPIARRIILMNTEFVLGRGIDHVCNSVDVDEVIREFVERTEFYARLEQMATDLWWCGELFEEFFDDYPEKGQTDFRTIDPSTIWEIITDPEDFRKVYYYHCQYSTPFQNPYTMGGDGKKAPKSVAYIIRQIPADKILHEKINNCAWEKRGRSDLFCIMGWLKRYKDLVNARVIKGILEGAFCWDITLVGGDVEVEGAQLQLPDPFESGSVFLHNDRVKLEPKASTIGGSDAKPDIDTLSNIIAVGGGTAKEFIGESSKGVRAGALIATQPPTKHYESRQLVIERFCHKQLDRVIQNAVDAGILDPDEFLKDARTVKRLGILDGDDGTPDRDDLKDEIQAKSDEAQAKQEKLQKTMMKQQNDLATMQQKHGHSENLAAIKAGPKITHKIDEKRTTKQAAKEAQALVDGWMAVLLESDSYEAKIGLKEAIVLRDEIREVGGALVKTTVDDDPLTDKQKKRIKAIKKSGHYSKELVEFSFPAIAQEERPQKLKDLALAEAMQWLPKSISATMAAKEMNISTYDFAESWSMIVSESEKGMSLAHVFGQDNQHVPAVTVAQSVQEELMAEQPITQPPVTNVPGVPKFNDMMQIPNKNAAGGAGGQPNTGDTKVNNKQGPTGPDPTASPAKSSAAGKHPATSTGAANIKKESEAYDRAKRSVLQRAIYMTLLKEATKPVRDMGTDVAQYILNTPSAVDELETATTITEASRIDKSDA